LQLKMLTTDEYFG